MPASVIKQVHCLARRAKGKKQLTFINNDNEDHDTLYANLDQDEDDIEPDNDDVELAGVNNDEHEEDDNDDDYNPESDSDKDDSSDADDSADEESDDEGDENETNDDTPGVDIVTPGVDDT